VNGQDDLSFAHYDIQMNTAIIRDFSRYLPIERDAVEWGLHVIDCGQGDIPAGAHYPGGQHPKDYLFTWKGGRRLNEFQIVYITEGRGVFESRSSGVVQLQAGHVLLLFPGEWHRYRPLKSTGWTEYWIGFNGTYARHIMTRFFSMENAVLRVGFDEDLLSLIQSVGVLLQSTPAGWRQIAAARAVEVLARIRSLSMSYRTADRQIAGKIQQARCFLLERAESTIDLASLAAKLGMSYSAFRSIFQRQTGSSPRQYQLQIRINKACALLSDTRLPVSRIAEQTGFSSVFYFSRLFSRKMNMSPMAFRSKMQQALPEIVRKDPRGATNKRK